MRPFSMFSWITLFSAALTLIGSVACNDVEARNYSRKDTIAPTITSFTVPSASSSLTVSGIALSATDNKGVTGYLLKESSQAPSAKTAGWVSTKPTSYTFASAGLKTLYAWAKDAAGNISTGRGATITITIAAPTPTPTPTATPTPTPTPTITPTTTPGPSTGSPTILSLGSSTVVNGASLIINGSGFGTRASYDTNNSGRLNWAFTHFAGATLTSAALNAADGFQAVQGPYFPDLTRGYQLTTSGARVSGKQYLKSFYTGLSSFECRNVSGVDRTEPGAFTTGEAFTSFWFKAAPANSGGKVFRIGDPVTWGALPGPDFFLTTGGSDFLLRASSSLSVFWGGPDLMSDGTWKRIDLYFKPGAAGTSVQKAWIVGANGNNPQMNVSFDEPLWTSGKLHVAIASGKCGVSGSTAENDYYAFDDVYMDFSQARIEICDTPSWSARTHCEIQIPQSWSPENITTKVNQGSFGAGSSAYVFVVDGAGNPSDGAAVRF